MKAFTETFAITYPTTDCFSYFQAFFVELNSLKILIKSINLHKYYTNKKCYTIKILSNIKVTDELILISGLEEKFKGTNIIIIA